MSNKNETSLLIQVVLIMGVVFSFILTIFFNEFLLMLEILFTLLMFTMAYNNQKFYMRHIITWAYVVAGVVAFISSLFLMLK